MTHNNVRDVLGYAAALLEKVDAGGTSPSRLRQIADVHDDLLAACKAFVMAMDKSPGPWKDEAAGVEEAYNMAHVAIAAARLAVEPAAEEH